MCDHPKKKLYRTRIIQASIFFRQKPSFTVIICPPKQATCLPASCNKDSFCWLCRPSDEAKRKENEKKMLDYLNRVVTEVPGMDGGWMDCRSNCRRTSLRIRLCLLRKGFPRTNHGMAFIRVKFWTEIWCTGHDEADLFLGIFDAWCDETLMKPSWFHSSKQTQLVPHV